jgi:hypothetical protein
MNLSTVKKLLKEALHELEIEVISDTPEITDEELKQILEIGKEKILTEMGIDVQEFLAYEESLKEIGREKGRKKKKELQDAIQETETRITDKLPTKLETLTTEAIRGLINDSVSKIPAPTTTIINKIEKETVVEKPQIIETRVEKEIDRTALDEFAKDIAELQTTFHDTLNEIKVSKDFMAGFDGKIEGRVKDLVSPELNKIARSFQSQIYRVSEDLKKVSPTETDPLSLHLDQTTPQTILNGRPIFSGGLKSVDVMASTSSGIAIKADNGDTAVLIGAGSGKNVTFYDGVKLDTATASKVVFTDANKNLTNTGIGTSSQFVKGDGSLDSSAYLDTTTAGTTYLKLDTSNDPLTGNLEISKADPELRLTDTGNSEYLRILKTDTLNAGYFKNRVELSPSSYSVKFNNNGVDFGEYATISSESPYDFGTSDFTISLWFYQNALDTGFGNLFTKGNTETTTVGHWTAYTTTADKIALRVCYQIGSPYYKTALSSNTFTDNTWNHAVFVRRSGTLYVYLNNTETSGDADTTNISTTAAVRLAQQSTVGAANRAFYGHIDEVATWNRALTVAEISDLYNSGNGYYAVEGNNFPSTSTPIATNLLGIYHFDTGSGSTLTDSSSNANNGTISGITDDDWVDGKVVGPGTPTEVNVIETKDGSASGELGTIIYGSYSSPYGSRTVLEGSTIRFNILNTEYMRFYSGGGEAWGRLLFTPSSGTVAGVINLASGTDLYFGETADTGNYYFRGRDLVVTEGQIKVSTDNKYISVGDADDAGMQFTGSALDIRSNRVGAANGINLYSGTDGINFYIGSTSQIKLTDGILAPVTTNDIDLGTSSLLFKTLYLEGNAIIDSDTSGLQLGEDQDVLVSSNANGVINIASANPTTTDITLNFGIGATNVGQLLWMEDEDYFQFSDDIKMTDNETILLGGTGFVDSPKYKAGGTDPVADGTYNFDGSAAGTVSSITTKGGIITAITTR